MVLAPTKLNDQKLLAQIQESGASHDKIIRSPGIFARYHCITIQKWRQKLLVAPFQTGPGCH
jgi:hypothetical protein